MANVSILHFQETEMAYKNVFHKSFIVDTATVVTLAYKLTVQCSTSNT